MKLGVIADCFKENLAESIKDARSLGLSGVQIYATSGEFSPEILTKSKKNEYKLLLSECGLEVSALCGDMGGHGFQIEKDNLLRIEKTKRIIDLAVEFNTKVVTSHIGVIPSDENSPQFLVMLKALDVCGEYAKSAGITMAIETGPEKALTLKNFIEKTHGGVGVNLDPANFVMVTGQDPVEAVYLLKEYIVHTHLKDGRRLKKADPTYIYGLFADGGIEALNVSDYFIETPVGEGEVNFDKYLKALRDIGYNGYLTIERETGKNPESDIRKAVDFIRTKI